ncbi:MAG: hypothetical protein WBX01_05020 [Nitrososphaeraceae archaeon]
MLQLLEELPHLDMGYERATVAQRRLPISSGSGISSGSPDVTSATWLPGALQLATLGWFVFTLVWNDGSSGGITRALWSPSPISRHMIVSIGTPTPEDGTCRIVMSHLVNGSVHPTLIGGTGLTFFLWSFSISRVTAVAAGGTGILLYKQGFLKGFKHIGKTSQEITDKPETSSESDTIVPIRSKA